MQQDLPPGFRFHPTDEELIVYYLCNQYTSKPCPAASSIIPEVYIYKFDPSDLPSIKKAGFGEKEWYFFSPRERKYPNGVRPNRATVSGYWKATGTDKAIYSGCKHIGVKKSLVFYKGKPLKGIKTGWIMHEYRLVESTTSQANKHVGSMRLDDWVLCRIYKKKKNMGKTTTMEEGKEGFPSNYQNEQEMMDNNHMGSVPQIFSDGRRYDDYSTFDLHRNNVYWPNSGIIDDYCSFVKPQIFAEEDHGGKFQVMKQSSSVGNSNQPMFMNQVYHL